MPLRGDKNAWPKSGPSWTWCCGPEAADDMGLAAKMTSGMFSTEMLRTLSESEERDAG